MTIKTAYEAPTGANMTPFFDPKARVKTNRDIVGMWVANGFTWTNANKNVPRKGLQTRGGCLHWHGVLIAEHFEKHTVIYENTERSVHDIVRLVQDVLLNTANYTQLPPEEPVSIDESLDLIFGAAS